MLTVGLSRCSLIFLINAALSRSSALQSVKGSHVWGLFEGGAYLSKYDKVFNVSFTITAFLVKRLTRSSASSRFNITGGFL